MVERKRNLSPRFLHQRFEQVARDDTTANLSETFTYDPLNRLLTATVASSVAPAKAFSYDAIGNMLSKSDVGTYTYPAPGQPKPHAVMSVEGSTVSAIHTCER